MFASKADESTALFPVRPNRLGDGDELLGYGSDDYPYSAANEATVGQNGRPTTPDFEQLDEGDASGADSIGPWQAAWNVTSAIQGMFIVSLPYTILHGGWWGVVALVGIAYICYDTGVLLVECLYDERGRRVRHSYREVAEACWGRERGGRFVLTAQLVELLMTCILYVVLTGDLLEGSFPDAALDKAGWMLLAAVLLLPCALLTDLRAVSRLSFWNTLSHVAINAVVMLYCLSQLGRWAWGQVRFTVNMDTFPTVLGIVVFSYTSHIFLPTLEGSLRDRRTFEPMLRWSHAAAAVFKAVFGFVGFLTFAEFTQEEVSNNLPSQQFKTLVNVILAAKALLSYPLPYFAAARLIEQQLVRARAPSCVTAAGQLREWAFALRLCLVLFTLLLALCVPHFALLMGLIGNVTGTLLSFVWPSLFHLRLKAATSSARRKTANKAIIALGLCFGVVGIYFSSIQLYRAIYSFDEYD